MRYRFVSRVTVDQPMKASRGAIFRNAIGNSPVAVMHRVTHLGTTPGLVAEAVEACDGLVPELAGCTPGTGDLVLSYLVKSMEKAAIPASVMEYRQLFTLCGSRTLAQHSRRRARHLPSSFMGREE